MTGNYDPPIIENSIAEENTLVTSASNCGSRNNVTVMVPSATQACRL